MSLFEKIQEFFESGESRLAVDAHQQIADFELHVATVVLLLEAACGDEEFDKKERNAVLQGIESEFGLSKGAAQRLLKVADEERLKTGDISGFLETVRDRYSEEQRATILQLIRKVIEADGQVIIFESVLYDFIRERLGLDTAEPESDEVQS